MTNCCLIESRTAGKTADELGRGLTTVQRAGHRQSNRTHSPLGLYRVVGPAGRTQCHQRGIADGSVSLPWLRRIPARGRTLDGSSMQSCGPLHGSPNITAASAAQPAPGSVPGARRSRKARQDRPDGPKPLCVDRPRGESEATGEMGAVRVLYIGVDQLPRTTVNLRAEIEGLFPRT
jgi:hypothetical protein